MLEVLFCSGKILSMAGGKIINYNAAVWPHEMRSASILCKAGYTVEFKPSDNTHRSADMFLNGEEYELKSPEGRTIRCIERNIKRGLKQSQNIAIDSHRVKYLRDASIVSYLKNNKSRFAPVKKIIFISRKGEIIEI